MLIHSDSRRGRQGEWNPHYIESSSPFHFYDDSKEPWWTRPTSEYSGAWASRIPSRNRRRKRDTCGMKHFFQGWCIPPLIQKTDLETWVRPASSVRGIVPLCGVCPPYLVLFSWGQSENKLPLCVGSKLKQWHKRRDHNLSNGKKLILDAL